MLSVSICKTTPSLSFCVPSSSSPSSFVVDDYVRVEVDVRSSHSDHQNSRRDRPTRSTRTHPNCSRRRGPTPLLLAFLLLLPHSKTRTRFDASERLFSGDDVYFRVASSSLFLSPKKRWGFLDDARTTDVAHRQRGFLRGESRRFGVSVAFWMRLFYVGGEISSYIDNKVTFCVKGSWFLKP